MWRWPFPYGHSVRPRHLGGFWRCPNFHLFFLALTVCPYDGGSKTGGRFGYLLLANTTFPSRIIIVCGVRVAETSARKSIDTHYEQPTSPLRPTATEVARRGLFLSAIFRTAQKKKWEPFVGSAVSSDLSRRTSAASKPPRSTRDVEPLRKEEDPG